MDISKNTAAFHDGSIIAINHSKDHAIVLMESAEMDEEDVKDDVMLSRDNRIRGKLHIEGIRNIQINNKPFLNKIKKEYDDGGIFSFEIAKNFVKLSIDWVNFPPKPQVNEFSVLKIEAEKIWWENTPT